MGRQHLSHSTTIPDQLELLLSLGSLQLRSQECQPLWYRSIGDVIVGILIVVCRVPLSRLALYGAIRGLEMKSKCALSRLATQLQ